MPVIAIRALLQGRTQRKLVSNSLCRVSEIGPGQLLLYMFPNVWRASAVHVSGLFRQRVWSLNCLQLRR